MTAVLTAICYDVGMTTSREHHATYRLHARFNGPNYSSDVVRCACGWERNAHNAIRALGQHIRRAS